MPSDFTAADVVGTDALMFLPVGHTIPALAGTALTGNLTTLGLDVRTDKVTLETNASKNLQVKDAVITTHKLVDGTVTNVKLQNPNVSLKVLRGLQRTTIVNSVTSAPQTDADTGTVLGTAVNLGENFGIRPDFTVFPDLQATKTFSANNTFTGP